MKSTRKRLATHLLERVVGADEDNKVDPIKTREPLMLTVGTATTVGTVASARANADELVFAKNSTPMIIGRRKDGHFLASDPNALAGVADEVYYVEDGQYGRLTPTAIELYGPKGPVTPTWVRVEWAAGQMPVIRALTDRFAKDKPFTGMTIGACLHVTTETANLVQCLRAGGAEVRVQRKWGQAAPAVRLAWSPRALMQTAQQPPPAPPGG